MHKKEGEDCQQILSQIKEITDTSKALSLAKIKIKQLE